MSSQRIVVIFLSIIGMVGTFLPWIKGLFDITIDGISSSRDDKSHLWLVLLCFLTSLLICFFNKSYHLKRWTLFGVVFSSILAALVGIFYLTRDLDSPVIDTFLGLPGASEIGLVLGPAPYIVFMTGLLIPIFGLALKQKTVSTSNNKN